MRLAVTGLNGQVVTALLERAGEREIVALGRPVLDLAELATIAPAIEAAKPDAIISAAAYTAVDKAEGERDLAFAINAEGAGEIARVAEKLNVPIIHLSTDYVFDGKKPTPYVEDDAVAPLGVYGASKLAGEQVVTAATANHAILRTAWVYSPFGNNFLKTMLRVGVDRDELRVVADQFGTPTSALDIADGILQVAQNLVRQPANTEMRGIFHMTGSGEANWADFAEAIFAASAKLGGPSARVAPITTAEYPTPAPRPANSRLDCTRLARLHNVSLPDWRISTEETVARLVKSQSENQ